MGSFESVGDFNREREKIIRVNRFAADAVLQRHTIEIFHRDERPTLVPTDLVDGADVGMVQGRGSTGFPREIIRAPAGFRLGLRARISKQ